MPGQTRERWSNRRGFILAAIGSAVGLGNMWRFSYLAAENGGAAFVLLYLLLTFVVGLPVLLAELAIGRGACRSPIPALAHFGGPAWRPLGWLFVVAGFLILSYYSVIAGWTVRYASEGILGGFGGDSGAHFAQISTGGWAVVWHLVFMVVTVGVVARGVTAGIERTALVFMPALFAIVLGLAVYAATLDGGGPGYAYYLRADFSEVLSLDVLSVALGQAFFSLSLGMGCIITFASYLDRSHNLPNESLVIAISDFGVAFIAGLVVFPVIFAYGLQGAVGESTLGALFITLPEAFAKMGAAGRWVGILFFGALVVGALTSAISMLEVVVSSAIDGLGWSRQRATWSVGAAIALLGVAPALQIDILGLMDQIVGQVVLVGGGLALSIFVGWVMPDPLGEISAGAERARWFSWWRTLLRYPVPILLFFVLVNSLGASWKMLADLF